MPQPTLTIIPGFAGGKTGVGCIQYLAEALAAMATQSALV